MKLLLDQDVYAITARFLSGLGHDTVTAKDLGLSRAADEEILNKAVEIGRILITRDRDFGNLVFVRELGAGVVYLRINPTTMDSVHSELKRVLEENNEKELLHTFVVVESTGYRIRRIPEK